MKRKKCSALLKGSLVLAAVLFMESSGVSGLGQQLAKAAEEANKEYGKYGTFDVSNSAEAAKEYACTEIMTVTV